MSDMQEKPQSIELGSESGYYCITSKEGWGLQDEKERGIEWRMTGRKWVKDSKSEVSFMIPLFIMCCAKLLV
jgi:hypothetical protein